MLSQFEMQPGHHFRIKRGHYVLLNIWVIAATNRDLQQAMVEKNFREDSLYFIGVF